MKINWRVRLKNPVWWVHVALSMVVPIIGYYGLTAQDFTSWDAVINATLQAIQNPYVLGCALVGAWNAVIDPTSKGLSDSTDVLKQTDPRETK